METITIVTMILTNVFVICIAIISNAKAYSARQLAEQRLFELENSYSKYIENTRKTINQLIIQNIKLKGGDIS